MGPVATTVADIAIPVLAVAHGYRPEQFIQRQQDPLPRPVPVDSKVRAKAEVVSIDEKGGGWYEVITRFTLEVEGNEKPCFVGDSVTRVMAPAD